MHYLKIKFIPLVSAIPVVLIIAAVIGAASYNSQVYEAQKVLKARGYNTGPADGLWGRGTKRALELFQRDSGLAVTGRLDETTLNKLGIASQGRSYDRAIKRKETKSAHRHALVIGNGAYNIAPLRNPANDARGMADALRGLGFSVALKVDADQRSMEEAIRGFGKRLRQGGVGLFYYAGHGMQVSGRNYLIPVNARIESESDVRYEAVDAGRVLGKMQDAENELNIVILDACRNNPLARSFRSASQGLARMDSPKGSIIAYSTAPGSVAADGEGQNSVYTQSLLKHIRTPGLTIERVFKRVRIDVVGETAERQTPWESSSLMGEFYFESSGAVVEAPMSVQGAGDIWTDPVTGMEFVWVPGGCFQMGSPSSEKFRSNHEGPVHKVCVDGFWMGKYEVTNAQYRQFKAGHYSKDYKGKSLNGNTQPAVNVSWNDAKAYSKWLSRQNGSRFEFRLPTEAEWEYAARSGTTTASYWGNDPDEACRYANVADQTTKRNWPNYRTVHNCDDGYAVSAPAGRYQPNDFGLYDMLGNVWEWCSDWYGAYSSGSVTNPAGPSSGSNRVFRGASWRFNVGFSRSAYRDSVAPVSRYNELGFRLVRPVK